MDATAASVPLTTADGLALTAEVAAAEHPIAAAVLCHPHPRFGGNRLNAVVAALYRALPAAGITALRFDFRPGAGADGGTLTDERLDTAAALGVLAATSPGTPLFVAGYSFGANVALGVAHPALVAVVAIAPTLPLHSPGLPALVLVPAHDQFTPPAAVIPRVADWPAATVETIAGADHFLVGHTAAVADRATAWLTSRTVAG